MAMKSWRDICHPKAAGGIGFWYFRDINSALLVKLGWKMAVGEDRLWCNLLRAKYMKEKSFFEKGKAKRLVSEFSGHP